MQHAALWLLGPDVKGLLKHGANFVAERGGNIVKDIADRFGDRVVVFMSIMAEPDNIARMDADKKMLSRETCCDVVFQPLREPTVPDGFQEALHGFSVVTIDAPGLIVELTRLVERFGLLIVGHTGERRRVPGPVKKIEAGQKFVVMLPEYFSPIDFVHGLSQLVEKYRGKIISPLSKVPGLLS